MHGASVNASLAHSNLSKKSQENPTWELPAGHGGSAGKGLSPNSCGSKKRGQLAPEICAPACVLKVGRVLPRNAGLLPVPLG